MLKYKNKAGLEKEMQKLGDKMENTERGSSQREVGRNRDLRRIEGLNTSLLVISAGRFYNQCLHFQIVHNENEIKRPLRISYFRTCRNNLKSLAFLAASYLWRPTSSNTPPSHFWFHKTKTAEAKSNAEVSKCTGPMMTSHWQHPPVIYCLWAWRKTAINRH